MKLSIPSLITATALVAALLAAGFFGLAIGEDRLFFGASMGAMLCCACIYFGAFMQGLRPAARPKRGHMRSLRQEVEALAEANPERPVVRRLYGWLLAMIGLTVALRVIAMFGS